MVLVELTIGTEQLPYSTNENTLEDLSLERKPKTEEGSHQNHTRTNKNMCSFYSRKWGGGENREDWVN